jgi:hypothetical protein
MTVAPDIGILRCFPRKYGVFGRQIAAEANCGPQRKPTAGAFAKAPRAPTPSRELGKVDRAEIL